MKTTNKYIFIIGLMFYTNLVFGQNVSKTLGFDFGGRVDFSVLNLQESQTGRLLEIRKTTNLIGFVAFVT